MNGVHDMGGMHGFGPIEREANEPVFHEDWEKVVFTINRAMQAQRVYNIDEQRHSVERMAPGHYLTASYFERWLSGMERNLIEKGVLTLEEIDARAAALREHPEAPLPPRTDPELVEKLRSLARRRVGFKREPSRPPRFSVGDAVVTRNTQPVGHTRLPRYARGKRGTISYHHGTYVLPDTSAHGKGECPEPLYSVRFEAGELWDGSAEPRERIFLDLWESYLATAGEPGS
jgi:nitrile hydratase